MTAAEQAYIKMRELMAFPTYTEVTVVEHGKRIRAWRTFDGWHTTEGCKKPCLVRRANPQALDPEGNP